MPKNLVLCCDGTANEFAANNTNVVKLYSLLEHASTRQVTYYHPGLGTMEPAGALTTVARKITKILGMAFGYGLADDIRDAYVFLMRNFEVGDKVYLFGFSRGAYTARAVASLIHMYGLIYKDNEPLVPYAVRMLRGIQRARKASAKDANAIDAYFELAAKFRDSMARKNCTDLFVGVWDTVSSIGWVENPLKLPYIADNPSIAVGRHAVSIDERRAFFRNHLWRPDPGSVSSGPKDLQQVWFPGVHCDVGGGYPKSGSELSDTALLWMLDEAKQFGLLTNPAKEAALRANCRLNCDAKAHESLKGWWNLAELWPKPHWNWKTKQERRRPNLWRRRTIPPQSLVHVCALTRDGGKYKERLPADVTYV